jgi:prepilin-type N-terminal cleavage/methylation domain-containing protein
VRRKGFTLVELLVVIGIIAVLLGILMPALGRARDQAHRVNCMSNMRNIMQGIVMYASENKNALPYCNWGGNPAGTPGWLYDNPAWGAWTPNAIDPDWKYMEDGAIYRYLKNRDVFRCPLHIDRVSTGATEKFTSYLMNGSVSDYGRTPKGASYKITKFGVMDIVMWETGESTQMGQMTGKPPFNDGCSDPREWITDRHGGGKGRLPGGKPIGNGGASVACTDGHVEWMSYKDYEFELAKPRLRPGKSRLWVAPGLPDGGWY